MFIYDIQFSVYPLRAYQGPQHIPLECYLLANHNHVQNSKQDSRHVQSIACGAIAEPPSALVQPCNQANSDFQLVALKYARLILFVSRKAGLVRRKT